jgi:ribosomal-protein-alanine N-acetyltransferase
MDIEPCKDLKEAEEIIQFHMDDSGCRYGLFNKTDGELVGTSGFHCWVKGAHSRAEIGFDLSRKYWGLGLMHEALIEIVRVGFDVMEIDFIEATVEQENIRSQRLLNKMGFSREEELRDNLYYYTLKKKVPYL